MRWINQMNQNPFGNLQNKPPIPSPHNESAPASSSSSGLLAYAPMFAIGIGVFVVLMAISYILPILFVGLAIIAIYVVLAIIATEKLKSLGEKLKYTISNREDLGQAAVVIDLNMKLAFVLMVVLFPLMVVSVLKAAFVCTLLIAVASFSLTPYTLGAEKKFKAMEVESFDAQLAPEFAAMLARWKEPGFGLKR